MAPHTLGRNRLRASMAVVALLTVVACGSASRPGSRRSTSATNAAQATVLSSSPLRGRVQDLVIRSSAVGQPVPVRILLPGRYATQPTRHWPVLYLLHGCCDSYVSWTRSTDIERLSRDLDALVVMPDGGKVGFYSDWLHGPGWETFHTQELPALLAARYRADGRAAIAGVSMGGLGALDYAARHPGHYAMAASFSGIVDTLLSDTVARGYLNLVSSQGEDAQSLWGDPATDANVWRAHNPYDLAPRLKGVQLFVSAGNGQPGPLDKPGTNTDAIESSINPQNLTFARRIRALHLAATVDLYGPGTHNWIYWQRELHRAWPLIIRALGGNR
jgi:diacylglycerol O-acyltransferase / trehalose O-mycolyltransferase